MIGKYDKAIKSRPSKLIDGHKHYLRTSTTFAMQILHARFRTLPSALTTSGESSIPNLVINNIISLDMLCRMDSSAGRDGQF